LAGALLVAALALASAAWLNDADRLGAQDADPQAPPAPGIQLQSGFTNVAYLGPTLPLPDALTNAADAVSAIWAFQAGAAGPP
jgi:hypothetical protein